MRERLVGLGGGVLVVAVSRSRLAAVVVALMTYVDGLTLDDVWWVVEGCVSCRHRKGSHCIQFFFVIFFSTWRHDESFYLRE